MLDFLTHFETIHISNVIILITKQMGVINMLKNIGIMSYILLMGRIVFSKKFNIGW